MKTLVVRSLSAVYMSACFLTLYLALSPTSAFATPINTCTAATPPPACGTLTCPPGQPPCALQIDGVTCNCV